MLNARERAELKSMNYSSKQHSGIKKALFWQDERIEISHIKRCIGLEPQYHIFQCCNPFALITSFYFNCHLEHYVYIPALIKYFSSPPITYSSLVPIRKHQWSGKWYCETFWGLNRYSSSKNVSATSGFLTSTVPLKWKMCRLMVLKSMPRWAATPSQTVWGSQDTATAPWLGAHNTGSAAKSKESLSEKAVPCHQHAQHHTPVHTGLSNTTRVST